MKGLEFWEVESDLLCQSQSGQDGVEDQEGFMLFDPGMLIPQCELRLERHIWPHRIARKCYSLAKD